MNKALPKLLLGFLACSMPAIAADKAAMAAGKELPSMDQPSKMKPEPMATPIADPAVPKQPSQQMDASQMTKSIIKPQEAKGEKKHQFKLPFDLYRLPVSPQPSMAQQTLNCADLEREISRLQPLTYSYQPGFYEDTYQGAAITIGTTIFWPVYFASGYIAYLDFQEKGRIISSEEKINVLRKLKAEKHCFES